MNFINIVKFDLLNILRNPMLVIVNTLGPLLLWAGFGLVTSGRFGGELVSSYDYYGIATMILSTLMISMTVTNTFMEEKVKKGNLRIAYSPVSKADIVFSKLISTYLFGTVAFSLICLIEQYLFHSNFGGNQIGYILLLLNMLNLFGCCLGTMVCVLFKSEERANAVMPIIAMLFIFFGGIFSPIGHYGEIMQAIANLSPVKWVLECAFQVIYDNDFSLFMPIIGCLLFLSFIFAFISQIIFKPEEYV